MAKFIKIKCKKCGNVQIVFERAAMKVECLKCGDVLALPTGGNVAIQGEFVEEVE